MSVPSRILTASGIFTASLVCTLHRLKFGGVDQRFAFPRGFVEILVRLRLERHPVDLARRDTVSRAPAA